MVLCSFKNLIKYRGMVGDSVSRLGPIIIGCQVFPMFLSVVNVAFYDVINTINVPSL